MRSVRATRPAKRIAPPSSRMKTKWAGEQTRTRPPVIHILPDDVLYRMFDTASRSERYFPGESNEDNGNDDQVPSFRTIITISHVCARWRSIALASSRLWSFIRVTGAAANRAVIEAALQRTETAPLSILFAQPTSVDSRAEFVNNAINIADVLTPHSERIHQLGITSRDPANARIVWECFEDLSMPNLRKLWLDTDGGNDYPTFRFKLTPSSLRVLHARNSPIEWLPFNDLIRLDILSGSTPTLTALLATLAGSPRLEVLRVRFAAKRGDIETPRRHGHVDLPCLRELLLSVTRREGAAFLLAPYITFPTTASVKVVFYGPLHVHTLKPSASQSLSAITSSVSAARLLIDVDRAALTACDPPTSSVALRYDGSFLERATYPRATERNPHAARLGDGFLAARFSALRRLDIHIDTPADDRTLTFRSELDDLFSALPQTVEELALVSSTHFVLLVLEALQPREGAYGLMVAPCPNARKWYIAFADRVPRKEFSALLEKCRSARAQAGAPVEHVEEGVAI
ncbi:hypothetical protein FKP32DRAFT_484135 [Trametes sanguinea]|nr:hypothetical protein FKP32DRAFT_484135 [Trametes sanguinea]